MNEEVLNKDTMEIEIGTLLFIYVATVEADSEVARTN